MSNQSMEIKVKELLELKRMKEELEAEITSLEDAIKTVMGDEETLLAGAFKVSWKTFTFPFENTYISCPKAYKEALTCQYGNWEKWVKAGTLHEGCFFDPDKPYTVYKNVNIVNIPNTL